MRVRGGDEEREGGKPPKNTLCFPNTQKQRYTYKLEQTLDRTSLYKAIFLACFFPRGILANYEQQRNRGFKRMGLGGWVKGGSKLGKKRNGEKWGKPGGKEGGRKLCFGSSNFFFRCEAEQKGTQNGKGRGTGTQSSVREEGLLVSHIREKKPRQFVFGN